jgi:hypothetical protein
LTFFVLVYYISTTLKHYDTQTLILKDTQMFNLYTHATNPNGFMALVKNYGNTVTHNDEINNRKIVFSFAIAGLIILSAISNGTEFQYALELDRANAIEINSAVI